MTEWLRPDGLHRDTPPSTRRRLDGEIEIHGVHWFTWIRLPYDDRHEIDPEGWPMTKKAPNATELALAEVIVTPTVRASLGERIAQASIDLDMIRALPYETPQDEADAAEIMNALRAAWKEVEEERTSLTKPLNAVKRGIDALFGPLLSKLAEGERAIKAALVAAQERRERLNEAARNAAILAAQNSDTAGAAAALAMVREETPPPGVYFREVWAFEVENGADVPRSFLAVDEAKVGAFVSACETSGLDPEIPGLRFFKRKIPVARPT